MFKHNLAPADASTVREAVEATTRWAPSLARSLAHFGTECVYRDIVSQALLFGPQPEIAPLAFEYVLFAAACSDTLRLFEDERRVVIPQPYKEVLLQANGIRSRAVVLFGIPSPANAATGLLDEWLFQPLSLDAAQDAWRVRHRPLDDQFMIGSLFKSTTQNSGLFLCDQVYAECVDGDIAYYQSLDDAIEVALSRVSDQHAA